MRQFLRWLYVVTFLLGALLVPAHAQQAPTYEWAWAGGGTPANSLVGSSGVAVDSVGNAYTLGGFVGTAVFEGYRLVCRTPRHNDLYLAKHSPQGRLLWIQQIGGPEVKAATGFTVDATGNIYLAGIFTDSITIGSTRLVGAASGTYDVNLFVAKFTPQGALRWARQTTSARWGAVNGTALAIDKAGNVYVAGDLHGQVRFDQFSLAPPPFSADEGFLARYTGEGVLEWVKTGYGPGKKTLAIGADGALYLASPYFFGLTLGRHPLPPPTSLNIPGLYLARLDAQFNCLWVRAAVTDDGYPFGPECYGLTPDPSSGGVVMSLLFGGPTTFAGRSFNCVGGCFPLNAGEDTGSDALILKLSARGHLQWHAQAGSSLTAGGGSPGSMVVNPSDIPGRASVDARGNVYVLLRLYGMPTLTTSSSLPEDGFFHNHLVAYSSTGRQRWTRPMPSTSGSSTGQVVWSPTGHLYASGNTYGPAQFDDISLSVTGTYNSFLAKLTLPAETATEPDLPPDTDPAADALLIPNIITPNGDAQNETFRLPGVPPGGPCELSIYSRWGSRVYHSAHYRQDWSAPGQPDGLYYYYLRLPNQPVCKGWLEVKR